MSKKSNPTVIGGFVIGAVALLIVAVARYSGFARQVKKPVTPTITMKTPTISQTRLRITRR